MRTACGASVGFVVLALMCLGGSAARAAELLNFAPTPDSPALSEFVWSGNPTPSLTSGPGSIGNADGTQPIASQTAPGLLINTPFAIPAVPGSTPNGSGGTTFFDCTFNLNGGFTPSSPAASAGGLVFQTLGNGSFSIFSTDPDGGGVLVPTLLLSGTVSASVITGPLGGSAGAHFSAPGTITYTGGSIFNAMIAAGGSASNGDVSVSYVTVTPTFSIAGSGFLSNFTANATGLFSFNDQVPEPTGLALIGLAGLGVLRRRR